jgi:nucleotide-binding universal stress UspA family protein
MMSPFRKLLCASDFSEDATLAAQRAAFLAATLGAELTLLHVVSEPSLRALRESLPGSPGAGAAILDDARRLLDEQAAALRESAGAAPITTVVQTGQVTDEILSASEHADLMVLGAHGQNPLRDMLIGTTAERLLRKGRRPILVTRMDPAPRYRRVLVPVDFSAHSAAAMRAAARIAPDAQLTALHVFELPFEGKLWLANIAEDEIHRLRAQARAEALRALIDLAASIGPDGERFTPAVEHGHAARSILARAGQLDADLIVIGKHGRSKFEELLIGSVTRHVLSDARCDVMVVHA